MHVKITTEAVWEKERRGVGSVIDVPADVFEANKSWMTATDEPLNDVPPSKKKAPTDEPK